MGAAVDWQREIIGALADLPLTFLNPRSAAWDSSWTPESEPFRKQVQWELAAQQAAALRVYVLPAKSLAPITLLELGLFGARFPASTIVCVELEYIRRGNVVLTADFLGIALVDSREALHAEVRRRFLAGAL